MVLCMNYGSLTVTWCILSPQYVEISNDLNSCRFHWYKDHRLLQRPRLLYSNLYISIVSLPFVQRLDPWRHKSDSLDEQRWTWTIFWSWSRTRCQLALWNPKESLFDPFHSQITCILVASLLATSGSVMAKQLLISPASNGFSHCSFCSLLPYLINTSMFPVSGAWQLKTSGAHMLRPMTSHIWAYSQLLSPAP